MVGIGTSGQPELTKGVHLRWAFETQLGFPPYGFLLLRKPSVRSEDVCLSKILAGAAPAAFCVAGAAR